MSNVKAKIHRNFGCWGSSQRSPRPSSWNKRPTCKGREGCRDRKGRRGRREEGREGRSWEGRRGTGGEGKTRHINPSFILALLISIRVLLHCFMLIQFFIGSLSFSSVQFVSRASFASLNILLTWGWRRSWIGYTMSTNTPLVVSTRGLLKRSLFCRRETDFLLSNPAFHSSTDWSVMWPALQAQPINS